MKKHNLFTYIIALGFIALGAFLILTNLDIISLEISNAFHFSYPFFIFGMGVFIILDTIRGNQDGLGFGSFLIVFGGLLIADRFDYVEFNFLEFWRLWPLLFIYIGISFFSPSKKKKKPKVYVSKDNDVDDEYIKKKHKKKRNVAIGDHRFDQPNWNVESMDLWNVIGDYHVDFTKAFIPDQETSISISGVIGDVKVIIPEHVDFQIHATIKTGDIRVLDEKSEGLNRDIHFKTPGYEEATKKLDLDVHFKIGDIKVDRV
ncbi:cell wall-active antibiotics response protein LiaF [Pontibacillus yanchengensis]|nr:cell wall-active antibiotics response protein LiaF [Pontibacillus yanchengensis]